MDNLYAVERAAHTLKKSTIQQALVLDIGATTEIVPIKYTFFIIAIYYAPFIHF